MRHRGRLAGLFLLVGLIGACRYPVLVESLPDGARMTSERGAVEVLPTRVDVAVVRRRGTRWTVKVEGFRELTIRPVGWVQVTDFLTDPLLRPEEARGGEARRRVELVLVPEHGPVGTWDAEELLDQRAGSSVRR